MNTNLNQVCEVALEACEVPAKTQSLEGLGRAELQLPQVDEPPACQQDLADRLQVSGARRGGGSGENAGRPNRLA